MIPEEKLDFLEKVNDKQQRIIKRLSNLLWNYSHHIEELELQIKELKAHERETKV